MTWKVENMERRLIAVIALIMLGALLLAEAAMAAPTSPLSATPGPSSRRDLSTLPAAQVDALAGNVTQLSIDALAITNSWQGYYGNVTGAIVLDDGNNNTFYNWSLTSVKGEVYAARVASPTWTTINCTAAANVSTEETALGQAATDADSVSNTFSQSTTHPGFSVGNVAITADSCYATNAFDNTGAQNTKFYQVLLSDNSGAGNIVYTALMNGSQTGFNGDAWDFELLVGEDGHGNSAVTPYYFFVELG